jgi:hypothetical protein
MIEGLDGNSEDEITAWYMNLQLLDLENSVYKQINKS